MKYFVQLKIDMKVKIACVHVIPYIHSYKSFFSVHINGDHSHVSRCKSYSWMETGLNMRESFSFGTIPSPNVQDLAKAREDLPLHESRMDAFEPSLYGTIIHAVLTLLAYVIYRICNQKKKVIIMVKINKAV